MIAAPDSIQLVNPRSVLHRSVVGGGWAQPVGLLVLATYLRRNHCRLPVDILDAEVLPQSSIEQRLAAKFIGFSCTVGNYPSVVPLAKKAKDEGARVVVGGPYATSNARAILTCRPEIDAVVLGPGERQLLALVQGAPWNQIPGLAYREGSTIVGLNMPGPPARLAAPDYALIHPESYWEHFARCTPSPPYSRPLYFPWHQGCPRFAPERACLFCSILPGSPRYMSPDRAWTSVTRLARRWGVDRVFDTGESFCGNRSWLQALADARPAELDFTVVVSSRAVDLDDGTIPLLKKIMVAEVFVGIESGTNKALQAYRKGSTVSDNIAAARGLRHAGIRLFPGVVLGFPGETEDTLAATKKHIEVLREEGIVDRVLACPLTPLPGSRAFAQLLLAHPEMRDKYGERDILCVNDLQHDWASLFCRVGYQTIQEFTDDLSC